MKFGVNTDAFSCMFLYLFVFASAVLYHCLLTVNVCNTDEYDTTY